MSAKLNVARATFKYNLQEIKLWKRLQSSLSILPTETSSRCKEALSIICPDLGLESRMSLAAWIQGGSTKNISRSEQAKLIPSKPSNSNWGTSPSSIHEKISSLQDGQAQFELCAEELYVASERQPSRRSEILQKAKLFRCLVEETSEALEEAAAFEKSTTTLFDNPMGKVSPIPMETVSKKRDVGSPRKSLIPVILEVHSHFHKPIRYDRTPLQVPVQTLEDQVRLPHCKRRKNVRLTLTITPQMRRLSQMKCLGQKPLLSLPYYRTEFSQAAKPSSPEASATGLQVKQQSTTKRPMSLRRVR